MKVIATQIAVVAAFRDFTDYTFEQYKLDFDLNHERLFMNNVDRQDLFEAELLKVNEQNELYKSGKSTWWAAINQFSVMHETEFAAMKGKAPVPSAPSTIKLGKGQNPTRKDWREDGAATPVKDQGGCGSCWAFASTECMESHYMIATKEEAILAPQYYVNCVVNDKKCGGTGGCEGAIAELAFNLTAKVGIPLEKDLPYRGRDGSCETYPEAVTCDGYHHLSPNDPDELESAIGNVGPVAVSAAANWGRYGGGVFEGGCSSRSCSIDHAVLAMGYDKDYWLIRNSWGASWGEAGYIRLTRSHDKDTFTDTRPSDGFACEPYPSTQSVAGESGILSDSAYPTNVRKASTAVQV